MVGKTNFSPVELRRVIASASNVFPHHIATDSVGWQVKRVNSIHHKSVNSVEAVEQQESSGQTCNATLFVEPLAWMQPLISRQPQGKLYCPKCKAKVGAYSWVSGVFTMANEFSLCFCANASPVRSSVHRMPVPVRRQASARFLFGPVKA